MPNCLKVRMARRAHRLVRCGVTPRALCRATRDDNDRYLRQDAPMQERLE